MSRIADLLNRLELAAKKLGISVEDAVEILLGGHPTHCVVLKAPPPTAPITPVAPTSSGPAVAPASPAIQSGAASTVQSGAEADGVTQSQVAAGSPAPNNED